jgi:plastocyanin
MKRYVTSFSILAAAVLSMSSPLLAHDGRRHGQKQEREESESAGPRFPEKTDVTIKLFQYQPGRTEVKAGTTVTWINEDEIYHTVTSDGKDDGFDAPLDGKGARFSFTFAQPGTYSFHCARHEHMRGEIAVR